MAGFFSTKLSTRMGDRMLNSVKDPANIADLFITFYQPYFSFYPLQRLNHALSLTFNLTAGLFLAIWSPFFILSVTDLVENMLKKKGLTGANFTLRCTLLILGSAKPIIYIICLEKFRRAFKCCYGPGKRLKGSTSGVVV